MALSHRHARRFVGAPLLLLALLAWLGTGCGAGRAASTAGTPMAVARYQLSLLPDGSGWQVDVELPPLLSQARLCAPALGTRRGESLEWLGAEADGSPAALAWDARGCFTAPRFAQTLRLRYRARIEVEAASGWRAISLSPHAEPGFGGLFFPGESLFVEVRDALLARLTPARVELAVPAGLALAATLPGDGAPRSAGDATVVHTFTAPHAHGLEHSAVWVEPRLSSAAGEVAGSGALGVDLSERFEGLEASALLGRAACLAEQLDSWVVGRAVAPGRLLVLHAAWDQAARSGFARSHGAVLQIGPATAGDPRALDSLLAHELFHRYNGGSDGLRYADGDYEATAWFREGATSYVAALTLVHAGVASEQDFAELLGTHASSYLANPARSAAEEGRAPATAVQRLSYDRGVLLSMALDLLLRDVSHGQRSLRGFFRYLSRSDAWQQPLSNRSLQSAVESYAGVALGAFFEAYVTRQGAIPVSALLRQAGLEVEPETREVAEPGMRLEYDIDNAWLWVTEVARGGPAEAAGVQVGDIVYPLVATRLGALESPQGPVEFELGRDGERRFVRLQPARRQVAALRVSPGGAGEAPWRALLDGVTRAPRCEVFGDAP